MNKETKKSNKCLKCDRPTHKESKYCIFHASAEEKTEEEFKESLKEYIEEIKKEDKYYDFEKFIFVGGINFKEELNIRRFKITNFSEATFMGSVTFSGVIFESVAFFTGATFESDASFYLTTFEIRVLFIEAIFKKNANFNEAIFKEYAYFNKATFEGFTYFNKATFEGRLGESIIIGRLPTFYDDSLIKDFSLFETTRKDDAFFNSYNLKNGANFSDVIFKEDSSFKLIYLSTNFGISDAKVLPGKKLSIHVINGKGKISFERTYLENSYLDIELTKGVLIDFTGALLKNTKIYKKQIENYILQEKEKKFSEAQEIYLLLKNNFHSIGRYNDESWAFRKEKDMERKSNCHFKTLHRWLWSCFLNMIYGYGEKPERVFLSAVFIILIFACVFMNCGIASPPSGNLPKYNILKELSTGILYGDLLNKCKALPKEQVIKSLYFSTVTFTTLGLGDFTPIDNRGRIYVGSEAFIGAFMMALFVYTFARRTGGR